MNPELILNNRIGKSRKGMWGFNSDPQGAGDFATPEQVTPRYVPQRGQDWETCMTMNDAWSYRKDDHKWKSNEELIRMLINNASNGGNFLLNVGPKGDGSIPQPVLERLAAFKDWMAVNSESIYGTTASPFDRHPDWGRVTTGKTVDGATRLYLHVFDWPESRSVHLPPMNNQVLSVKLLDGGQTLVYSSDAEGTHIELPKQSRNKAATVLAMNIKGAPDVEPFHVAPNDNGVLHLAAADAYLFGDNIRYTSHGDHGSIGHWTVAHDWVKWPVKVERAGAYTVKVTYGCAKDGGGGDYAVEVGDQELVATARTTDNWLARRTHTIGEISLPAGKIVDVAVRIRKKTGHAVLDLVSVELVPQKASSP